ncbi:hypothetical protein HK096_003263, partial [Nowakowskiella sp. JEL0078]
MNEVPEAAPTRVHRRKHTNTPSESEWISLTATPQPPLASTSRRLFAAVVLNVPASDSFSEANVGDFLWLLHYHPRLNYYRAWRFCQLAPLLDSSNPYSLHPTIAVVPCQAVQLLNKDFDISQASAPAKSPSDSSQNLPKRSTSRKSANQKKRPVNRVPVSLSHDTHAGLREPLIDEVAATLREWSFKLPSYFQNHDSKLFTEVKLLFHKLYILRRRLLSPHSLTIEVLASLKRDIIKNIDLGNEIQGLDRVIRHHEKGFLLTDANSTLLSLYRQHIILPVPLTPQLPPTPTIETNSFTSSNERVDVVNDNHAAPLYRFTEGITRALSVTKSRSSINLRLDRSDKNINAERVHPLKNSPSTTPQLMRTGSTIRDRPSAFFHIELELKAVTATLCSPGEQLELFFGVYHRGKSQMLNEEFVVVVDMYGVPVVLLKKETGPFLANDNNILKAFRPSTIFLNIPNTDLSEDAYLVCRIVRVGRAQLEPSAFSKSQTDQDFVRRPGGCAVLDIGSMLPDARNCPIPSGLSVYDRERTFRMNIFTPVQERDFSILADLVIANSPSIEMNSRIESLTINLKFFHSATPHYTPAQFRSILTPSRSLHDPSEMRNSLYLTLVNGDFQSRKNNRNFEVAITLRTAHDEIIPSCITRATGEVPEIAVQSVVYSKAVSPIWNETYRIDLPPQLFQRSHIYIQIRAIGKQEPAFGFAVLPLAHPSGNIVENKIHTLSVYRDRRVAPSVYLYWDNNPEEKAANLRDFINVKTELSSSMLTHTPELIALLYGNPANSHNGSLLNSLRGINDTEIVKFLERILDRLVVALNSTMDGAVLDTLVFVLSVASDKRFVGVSRGILDKFLVEGGAGCSDMRNGVRRLMAPVAWRTVVREMAAQVRNAGDGKGLRDLIKVWGWLVRFVVAAHETSGNTLDEVRSEMRVFFSEVNGLMRVSDPGGVIGAQGLAIQNYFAAVTAAAGLFTTPEIVELVVTFVDCMVVRDDLREERVVARMVGHKMVFITQIVRTAWLEDPIVKTRVSSAIMRWIIESIGISCSRISNGRKVEIAEIATNTTLKRRKSKGKAGHTSYVSSNSGSTSLDEQRSMEIKVQCDRELLRLCCEVAAEFVDKIQKISEKARRKDVAGLSSGDDDIGPGMAGLFQQCLDVFVILTSDEHVFDDSSSISRTPIEKPVLLNPELTQVSVILLSILHFTNENDLLNLINTKYCTSENKHQHMIVLWEYMFVLSHFIKHASPPSKNKVISIFPDEWPALQMLTHKLVLKALRPLGEHLKDEFSPHPFLVSELTERRGAHFSVLAAHSDMMFMNRLLWADYLTVLISLLKSSWVQTERFSPLRARLALKLNADVRCAGAKLLRGMWNHLSKLQVVSLKSGDDVAILGEASVMGVKMRTLLESIEPFGAGIDSSFAMSNDETLGGGITAGLEPLDFVPGIVASFIELSMCADERVRNTAVELLFSVMEREFMVTEVQGGGEFARIEKECMSQIDQALMANQVGTHEWRRFFICNLKQRFSAMAVISSVDDPSTSQETLTLVEGSERKLRTHLADLGHQFISALDQFMDLCLTVRDLPDEVQHDTERMSAILKLMNFIRGIDRKDVYVKYAHQMSRMHYAAGNYVEAALTLKLHLDLPDILPNVILPDLKGGPDHPYTKDMLFELIYSLLKTGKAWERALELIKEKILYHETVTFQYDKVIDLRKRQIELLEFIKSGSSTSSVVMAGEAGVVQQRMFPSFYRVGFFGLGWPVSLQNKQFVYRAGEWERLGDFSERIVNCYDGAKQIRSNAALDKNIQESTAKFIQITAVEPEMDPRRLVGPGGVFEKVGDQMGPRSKLLHDDGEFDSSSGFDSRNSSIGNSHTECPPRTIFENDLDPEMYNEEDRKVADAYEVLEKVPEYVRSYYKFNEVNFFSFSRPVRKPLTGYPDEFTQESTSDASPQEFLEMWSELTILITEDRFPCLLRRSPSIASFTIELSPIENAIIAVRKKNKELKRLFIEYTGYISGLRHMSAPTSDKKTRKPSNPSISGFVPPLNSNFNVNPFSIVINGAVDAPVNGGLPMYRKAFMSSAYRNMYPQDAWLVSILETAIEKQANILDSCIKVHAQLVPPQMSNARFLRTFEEEISRLPTNSNANNRNAPKYTISPQSATNSIAPSLPEPTSPSSNRRRAHSIPKLTAIASNAMQALGRQSPHENVSTSRKALEGGYIHNPNDAVTPRSLTVLRNEHSNYEYLEGSTTPRAMTPTLANDAFNADAASLDDSINSAPPLSERRASRTSLTATLARSSMSTISNSWALGSRVSVSDDDAGSTVATVGRSSLHTLAVERVARNSTVEENGSRDRNSVAGEV